MSDFPTLCERCEERLHAWMANKLGKRDDIRMCPICAKSYEAWKQKNKWTEEGSP